MLSVVLYTRKGCHLCDQAKKDLEALGEILPHQLVEVDIESDEELEKRYAQQIPVVEVGPYRIKAPFTRQELEIAMRAAGDRHAQFERLGSLPEKERPHGVTRGDRISYWLARHYLLIFNLILFLYVGIPFLAPVFKYVGWDGAATVVHKMYRPLCHQWGFRSFFLFGEQLYYPHAEAGIPGVITFEEATGITDANDPGRMAAREYEGDETVGYKVALCQRDVAIWGSLFLFGLVYAISGRRIPPLHWLLLTVIGLLPAGLDGFSQLISQVSTQSGWLQELLPYRESTPLLRVITGSIFGISMGWMLFTYTELSMAETRRELAKRFAAQK